MHSTTFTYNLHKKIIGHVLFLICLYLRTGCHSLGQKVNLSIKENYKKNQVFRKITFLDRLNFLRSQ